MAHCCPLLGGLVSALAASSLELSLSAGAAGFATSAMIDLPKRQNKQITTSSGALDRVLGLRWGRYVGSPSLPQPKVVWRGRGAAKVAAFAALDNHEVHGLPAQAGLVVRYSQDAPSSSSMSARAVCGAGVVTFGHPDGILRVKLRKSAGPQLFKARAPSAHEVSVLSVGPEGEHVWLGFDSGKVSALSHTFSSKDLTVTCGTETALYGHSDRVTCLDVCDPFGVTASGSADGSLVLWDSKKLLFVRRLHFAGEVNLSLVPTTGLIFISLFHP